MQSILAAYNRTPVETMAQPDLACPESGFPLENEPELVELVELLRAHNGFLLVSSLGREFGVWYPEELSMENRPARLRVNDLVYRGAVVPDLLILLSPGAYDAAKLARFVGMDEPAAQAKRGAGC